MHFHSEFLDGSYKALGGRQMVPELRSFHSSRGASLFVETQLEQVI